MSCDYEKYFPLKRMLKKMAKYATEKQRPINQNCNVMKILSR